MIYEIRSCTLRIRNFQRHGIFSFQRMAARGMVGGWIYCFQVVIDFRLVIDLPTALWNL